MKIIKNATVYLERFLILLPLALIQSAVWAQDDAGAKVDINISKEGNWYTEPWVWVIGAAIFILLLVALLRGNSNKT